MLASFEELEKTDIFNTERFIKKEKYIAPIVNIRYHNQYQTSTKEKGVDNP